MKRLPIIAALATLALTVAMLSPSNAAALTAKVNHDEMLISLGYHGGSVSVSGQAEAGVDLIIKIAASGGEEKMKKAQKVGGAIWMNTKQLTFTQTPGFYYLSSTKAPAELLNREQLLANGIGYDALAENAVISPAPPPQEKAALFADFVMFKESKQLYSQTVGGIEVKSEGGSQTYTTLFDWPFQAPPGRYQVTVYAVRSGNVVGSATSEVSVEEAGAVKALADLAGQKGALYGVAAIGVALIAGIGVGMVFGKGGGAH